MLLDGALQMTWAMLFPYHSKRLPYGSYCTKYIIKTSYGKPAPAFFNVRV